jgi:hypothetical protein
MRYNPPDENPEQQIDENPEEPVYWEGRPRYISDQTIFMRWSTELEQTPHVIDEDFINNNKHRVMDINKFLPLSFIDNPKSIKLFRLRRMNIVLAKDAGLMDLADETVLDNLSDYQTTRGVRGNYQNALITQKREWMDKSEMNKQKGLFSRLVKAKNDESKVQDMMEVY